MKVSAHSTTASLAHNDADQVLTEGYRGGTVAALCMENVYHNRLR